MGTKSMEDKLERYILDIESILAVSTVEEGKLREALAHSASLEAQLREAIESRDVIGQATGMLMDREGLHADEAFDMLRVISERFDLEVREVAALLIAGSWTQAHPGEQRDTPPTNR